MDCRRIAHFRHDRFWNQVTCVATLIAVGIFCLLALLQAGTASAGEPRLQTAAVVQQSKDYQYQFRTGDASVLAPWTELLEVATKAAPDDADLWYWLGYVYLAQGAQALATGKLEDASAAMQKGPAALRQALKINPDHPDALAQIGGIQTLLGPVLQLPAMAPRGVAQMNRAVELAPDSLRVRLVRAFTGPNVPEELRNRASEAEDLEFLMEATSFSRAGDYVSILRADLYVETGEPEQARHLYEVVSRSASPAAALARTRLGAMRQGGVDMTAIRELRTAAGAQCALCHGR